MSQFTDYIEPINSDTEKRNTSYLGFVDKKNNETIVENDQRIIEQDHNFSNIDNNNNNINNGEQLYEEQEAMNDKTIYVFENEEDNTLFEEYGNEINFEENEFKKELSELFKDSNKIK